MIIKMGKNLFYNSLKPLLQRIQSNFSEIELHRIQFQYCAPFGLLFVFIML